MMIKVDRVGPCFRRLNTRKPKRFVFMSQIIERIEQEISLSDFCFRFLIPNRPVIFSERFTQNWTSRKDWVDQYGKPRLDFLSENYGKAEVCVVDCNSREHGDFTRKVMRFDEIVNYWKNQKAERNSRNKHGCLYVKDWHFCREFPEYKAYEIPVVFQGTVCRIFAVVFFLILYYVDDWMDAWWKERKDVDDDFRFVYIGTHGTWTPFHADVFRSYSWSANICGRKHWTLFPPGEEKKFVRGGSSKRVWDIREADDSPKEYTGWNDIKRIEFTQQPGEIVFGKIVWNCTCT